MACSPSVFVVPRRDWGAVAPKSKKTIEGAVHKVVIHHTAVKGCDNLEDCMKQLLGIQTHHMTKRDFDDIGYNFLVAADGTLFEGRGWGVAGAHAKGHNDDSVGIAFMGNSEEAKPSPEAISAVKKLLQCGVSSRSLGEKYELKGHKDFGQTICPGKNLYDALPQLRSSP